MTKRTINLAVIGTLLTFVGLSATAEAEVRVGPNYRLNDDASKFRAVDQIGLTVSRSNPQHLVAVNANYLDLRCEASRSLDGGQTWSPAVALAPVAAAALSSRCAFHQSVEFGSGQNVYAIVTANKTNTAIPDTSVVIYKSTDGGLTWLPGVVVMDGGPGTNDSNVPSPGPNFTRPDLAVEPGAGTGGADRIYAAARDFVGTGNSGTTPACTTACDAVHIAVSNDGGATYTQKANASPVGVDASDPVPVVLNADGSLSVVWRTAGIDGILQSARSTNGGTSWSAPVDIAKVKNTARSSVNDTHLTPIENPPASGPLSSTTATYPRMASDPNTAGRLYLVYIDTPGGPTAPAGGFLGSDHFINFDATVWFQRSNDYGATWSTPKKIDDNTPKPGARTVQTRHPNVSVSPNGRVNVVWHDRRHWFQGPGERNCTHSHIYCDDIRLGDTYYAYSTNGGTSFSDNIRISDRSHNNDVGYDTRPASGYWSWGPQVVTIGSQVLIGWMDSREGNWDTDTEDFYLAKVDFDAGGAVPKTMVDQPDAIARSVALSKIGYPAGNEGALIGGAKDPANQNPTLASPPTGPASRNGSSVVIVNENDVAGAMAATVLARANPGPVLLSPAAALPTSVKDEIQRIRPARVFLIGDTTKLSSALQTEAGLISGLFMPQVVRLDGGSDAATAALIADRMDNRTAIEKDNATPATLRPAFDAVVIVNPASAESAAAVGLAAARRLPILFTGVDAVPAATTTALGSTDLDIDKTLVVGGTSSVSASVLSGLPNATRLGGATVYDTSQAVVNESKTRGLPSNVVYVADATKPMDAALLGGVAARATGILALAPAPLFDTAATQAGSYGLSGISELLVVGPNPVVAPPPPPPPPPPAEPPPPVPPPPPPPPPPAAGDTVAPTAKLSGAVIQKLLPTVRLTVSCTSEACTAAVSATVQVPKLGRIAAKTHKLKSVSAKLSKGAKRNVALKLPATLRQLIVRAMKARKVISVKFLVKVTDAAGNSRTLRRSARLKR